MPLHNFQTNSPPQMLESLLEPLPLNPEPYVNRLLCSNDAPLDWEALIIRRIISDDEDRMRALDAHNFHLQATRAQLSQRRDETVEHLRVHRAILSPIRRMPVELMCTIFALASAQNRMKFGMPPWQLGSICSSWRQYALSYPLLWSSITITCHPCYFGLYKSKTQRLLSKLQTQLSRATNHAPLDIHWSCATRDVPDPHLLYIPRDAPDSRLLDLILPHSNRWRNVSFDVSEKRRLDWLLPTCGKLDQLETLEVKSFGDTTFPDIFTTAPNLRRVVLTRLRDNYRATLKSIVIPWGQITHHRGEFPGARQLEFLQAAPNLLNCALEVPEGRTGAFIPRINRTVVLPHLRRLCLDSSAARLKLVAPELEELCFMYGMWLPNIITPFIRRASCTLTRLVLWSFHLQTELTDVLRALPTLSYLLLANDDHMHHEKGRVAFFATMAISGTDSDICPHIVSMVYGYENWDNHAEQDAFISMAKSRFRTQTSLRSQLSRLRVFRTAGYLERYEPPTLDMKQMLQDEGLDVAFSGEHETTDYLSRRYI